MAFPWKVALVGGGALLALVVLSGESKAGEPLPPGPKLPPVKPPPGRPTTARAIAVPIPMGGPGIQAYSFRIKGTGIKFRQGPSVNDAVLYMLNEPERVIVPDSSKARGEVETGGSFAGVIDPSNGQTGWVSTTLLTDPMLEVL